VFSTILLSITIFLSEPLIIIDANQIPTEIPLMLRWVNPKSNEIISIEQTVSPWKEHINNYSLQYNIDPALVAAVLYTESRGNPNAVSHVGAQGLMQIMPNTGGSLGMKDAFDPQDNIHTGVKYIAQLMNHYDDDEYYTLWAWNAGSRRVANGVMPSETKKFISKVMMLKEQL